MFIRLTIVFKGQNSTRRMPSWGLSFEYYSRLELVIVL